MRNRRISQKYLGGAIVLSLVCTLVFLVFFTSSVSGRFVSSTPYVTGEPQEVSVVVTDEGGNKKGEDGTGVAPCSSEVPTAKGEKGSKTNPFVVLEIVPEKEQQQLVYLGGDETDTDSLDVMKLGIEKSTSDKSPKNDAHNFLNEKFGTYQWFAQTKYSVYKIGSKTEREDIPLVKAGKLYSLKIPESEIKKAEIDVQQFKQDYEKCKSENQNGVKSLAEKYPSLFKKDSNGVEIRDISLGDTINWETQYSKEVMKKEVSESRPKAGFILAVKPGEGDFGFVERGDTSQNRWTVTGTEKDRFVVVENREDLPEGARQTWNYEDFYTHQDEAELTGTFAEVCSWGKDPVLITEPEVSEYVYTFEYWGLKRNNILKRYLFNFEDQKDYDNFNMRVICMTPAELNQMKDTDDTLDMIERADMFFISPAISSGSDSGAQNIYKFYHKMVKGDEQYSFNKENVATFYENDLEWDLCTKILIRLSQNEHLPLVFNKVVGKMLEEGVNQDGQISTHMYVTQGLPDVADSKMVDRPTVGSLNNLTKLYLVTMQFDLHAEQANNQSEKQEGKVSRTFMDSIFPYIKKIRVPKQEGMVDGSAKETGYYVRPLCSCADKDQEWKERSYYLWNNLTFFPTDLNTNVNKAPKLHDETLSEEEKKELQKYIDQGYLSTYFDVQDNPFLSGSIAHQQMGSDGKDGNNTAVIGEYLANVNESTLIGNASNSNMSKKTVDRIFDVAYKILNSQGRNVVSLSFKVLKRKKSYVKLSDDAILIDYQTKAKYDNDKEILLKVMIRNANNEDAVIRSVHLNNDSGDSVVLQPKRLVDSEMTEMKKENISNSDGNDVINGYRIHGVKTFYIPFSLYDWQRRYQTIQVVTTARMHIEKDGIKKFKSMEKTFDVTINERTLFDLE